MKVFVTGGSGFVGREIIRQLIAANHSVRALTRQADAFNDLSGVEIVVGDTTLPETLLNQLSGCDAVINLVGIIREFPAKGITFKKLHVESTDHVMQASVAQGINRFLQMSANGSRKAAITSYHQTKWQAEELLRQSKLEWTVFRPSLIFGTEDKFVTMLAQLIKTLPIIPVMGDGQYQLQPVCVIDIAKGFVAALDNQKTIGRTYHCCGAQAFSYNQMLDLIAQALGQVAGTRKIHLPLWLMRPLVAVLQTIPAFPITSEQLLMLLEGNICNDGSWQKDLGLELHNFTGNICTR